VVTPVLVLTFRIGLLEMFCTWKPVAELVLVFTMTLADELLVSRFMLPVPPWMVVALEPMVEPTVTVLVELAVALLPRLIVWATAPVVLPIWMVPATPALPTLIVPPEPVDRAMAPLPVPPWMVTVWAAVVLPMATPPVLVPVPMFTALLLLALRLMVPPEMVAPALPVRRPALVIVPVPVVEILPEVVILSPEVAGCRVVPERLQ
jgi:hypothetical protein